jgi:hypothetical protein
MLGGNHVPRKSATSLLWMPIKCGLIYQKTINALMFIIARFAMAIISDMQKKENLMNADEFRLFISFLALACFSAWVNLNSKNDKYLVYISFLILYIGIIGCASVLLSAIW